MQMVAGVVEGLSDEDDDDDEVDEEEEQEAVEAVPVLLSLEVRRVFAVPIPVARTENDEKVFAGAGLVAGTKEALGAATRGFLCVIPSWSSSVLFVRVLPRRFFIITGGVGGAVQFLVGALCGALRSPLLLLPLIPLFRLVLFITRTLLLIFGGLQR